MPSTRNMSSLALKMDDGVGSSNSSTERMNLFAKGNVNLETEAINVDFNTELRKGIGVSIGDVFNPFTRIGGTLAKPALVVDEKGAFLEGGTAIATGGLTTIAKGLRGRFFGDKQPCESALTKFNERD